MSLLCSFIQAHPNDWEDLLQQEPYYLKISHGTGELSDLCMFKYSQLESDFNHPIVQEARGIIVDLSNLQVISFPFRKFGNYMDDYADTIDWNTARVLEKIDGSLISVWNYHNKWYYSTSGTIDAHDAPTRFMGLSFYDVLQSCSPHIDETKLIPGYTYMFELTTPYTTVVIQHQECHVTHIGTRNNQTEQEVEMDIGIQKPKQYHVSSLSEALQLVETLNQDSELCTHEGFVVVDGQYRRNKIKTPEYIRLHHFTAAFDQIEPSIRGIWQILKQNEQDEVLGYFPHYKPYFKAVQQGYQEMYRTYANELERLSYVASQYTTRKEFALAIQNEPYRDLAFAHLYRNQSITEYFEQMTDHRFFHQLREFTQPYLPTKSNMNQVEEEFTR